MDRLVSNGSPFIGLMNWVTHHSTDSMSSDVETCSFCKVCLGSFVDCKFLVAQYQTAGGTEGVHEVITTDYAGQSEIDCHSGTALAHILSSPI